MGLVVVEEEASEEGRRMKEDGVVRFRRGRGPVGQAGAQLEDGGGNVGVGYGLPSSGIGGWANPVRG